MIAEALFRAVHHRTLAVTRPAAVDCVALEHLSGSQGSFNPGWF